MSSVRSGEAFMIACAKVEVGVYGFSARSWLADESAGESVFRALWEMVENEDTSWRLAYGKTAWRRPHVLSSIRKSSSSS
jgi:hypothetical protein